MAKSYSEYLQQNPNKAPRTQNPGASGLSYSEIVNNGLQGSLDNGSAYRQQMAAQRAAEQRDAEIQRYLRGYYNALGTHYNNVTADNGQKVTKHDGIYESGKVLENYQNQSGDIMNTIRNAYGNDSEVLDAVRSLNTANTDLTQAVRDYAAESSRYRMSQMGENPLADVQERIDRGDRLSREDIALLDEDVSRRVGIPMDEPQQEQIVLNPLSGKDGVLEVARQIREADDRTPLERLRGETVDTTGITDTTIPGFDSYAERFGGNVPRQLTESLGVSQIQQNIAESGIRSESELSMNPADNELAEKLFGRIDSVYRDASASADDLRFQQDIALGISRNSANDEWTRSMAREYYDLIESRLESTDAASYLTRRAADAMVDWANNYQTLADLSLGDASTGGSYSEGFRTLTQYAQSHPATYRSVMSDYVGGNRSSAQELADATGVSVSVVRAWQKANEASFMEYQADTAASGLSPWFKENIGDTVYQTASQIPSWALSAVLGGWPGLASGPSSVVDGIATGIQAARNATTVSAAASGFASAVGQGMLNAAAADPALWFSFGIGTMGRTVSQNAMERGYDPRNYLNGALMGFSEVFSENFSGFGTGNNPFTALTTPKGSRFLSVLTAMGNYLLTGAEEGLEELINVPMQNAFDNLTYGGKKLVGTGGIFDFQAMWDAGVSGAVMGAMLGSVGTLTNIATDILSDSTDVGSTAYIRDVVNNILNKPEFLSLEDGTTLDALDPRTADRDTILARVGELLKHKQTAMLQAVGESYIRSESLDELYNLADQMGADVQVLVEQARAQGSAVTPELVGEIALEVKGSEETSEAALPTIQPTVYTQELQREMERENELRERLSIQNIDAQEYTSDTGYREALSRGSLSENAAQMRSNLYAAETARAEQENIGRRERQEAEVTPISEETFSNQFSAAYNTGRAYYDRTAEQRAKVVNDYGEWAGTAFDLGAAEVADIDRRGAARARTAGTVTDITQAELQKLFKNGGAIAPSSRNSAELAKMSKGERDAYNRRKVERKAVEYVAKAVGAKVVLYESTSEKTANGWYDHATGTIYLDVKAGDFGNRSMLRAMAHELTHLIQTRSKSEYAALRSFILDKYFDGKQELLDRRVNEAMENDPSLKPEYALDEVIADSCEMMLRDTEAIKQIYNENRGLFNRIKDFIDKVVKAIKEAFTGVDTYSEAANDMREYWGEIQKLWDAGLVAASQSKEQSGEGDEVQQSARGRGTRSSGISEVLTDGELKEPEAIDGGIQYSVRRGADPKKTVTVYKLMRLVDGELYPLFIDSTEPLSIGTWYDADSPSLDFLRKLRSGIYLVDPDAQTSQSFSDYLRASGEKVTKYPSKEAIRKASEDGKRWVYIEDTGKTQKRFGESRRYWNLGINGSGAVSTFSMRPGYHAGSLPTMRQIGKGANRNLRDDSFVWTEGEIPADVNYQQEANSNPDKDIPTHIPTNGYYLKATNADAAKSQADRVGWYVAGSYKINRIISDSEARQIISDWNTEHQDAPVEFDYERESGMDFDAETMSLVPKGQFSARRSKLTSIDMVDAIDNFDGIDESIAQSLRDVKELYSKYRDNQREVARINEELRGETQNRDSLEKRKASLLKTRDNLSYQIDAIMEQRGVRDFLEAERTEMVSLFEESAGAGRDYVNRYYNAPMRQAIEAEQNRTAAAREQTRLVREAGQERLDAAEQEWRERFAKLRQRYSDSKLRALEKQAEEMRMSFRERMERQQERRVSSALRETVRNRLARLVNMIETNNDKTHIITELRGPVVKFIEALNPIPQNTRSESARQAAERWREALNGIQNLANENAPVTSLIIEQNKDAFKALSDQISNLESLIRDNSRLTEMGENIQRAIIDTNSRSSTAATVARGTLAADTLSEETSVIDYMNSEQLTQLNRVLRAVQAIVNSANRVFANAKYESRQQMVDASHAELDKIEGDPAVVKVGNGKVEQASLQTQRFLAWRNGTPYYVFKRFGDVGKNLYMSLAKGWGQMSQDVHSISEAVKAAGITEKETQKWRDEVIEAQIPTLLGKTKTAHFTMAQLMSLYCHFRQEQSLLHINGGGFTFAGSDVTRTDYNTYHMSLEEAQALFDQYLPVGSAARNAADFLQHYMQTVGARMGNVVTRALYGYEYFNPDEYYFPVRASDDQMADKTSDPTQSLFALLHMTETRARTPKANSKLVVGDIFDIFNSHMADMAKYKNLALPVLDIVNWLNARTSSGTIKEALRKAFGAIQNGDRTSSIAGDYVSKFVRDINATYSGGGLIDQEANKFLTRMKKAAVAASLRVALQQPFSYTRAMYTMKPRYLLRSLGIHGNLKQNIDEAMKWSGLARAKSEGAFSSDLSPTLREQIIGSSDWRDKVSQKAIVLAEKMDEVTWGAIWRAAKYQVENEGYDGKFYKKGSNEYFEAVRAVFDEVILSTQVMDGTLTRSEFMRDTTLYSKIMTAFMAEPTLTYNMMLDGLEGVRLAKRSGGDVRQARGKLARAMGTWAATQIANALITALVDSFRDDDDYERFFDKFADHFGSNLLDNINPLDGIPLIKTMWELIVATWKGSKSPLGTEFQGITQSVKALRGLYDTLRDEKTEANSYGKMSTWGLIYSGLQAVSYLSGLPIANFSRTVTGAYNVMAQVWNDVFAPLNGNYLKHITTYNSDTGGYDELFQAEVNGNTQRQQNLLAELAVHGIEGDSIGKEMRTRTRDAFIDGSIGAQKARSILTEYGFDADDVEEDINFWTFKRDYPGIEKPTSSMANAYYATFQSMGIPAAEFAQYWRYIHGDGITQDEVRTYISSLQIPGNVKAALWGTKYTSAW